MSLIVRFDTDRQKLLARQSRYCHWLCVTDR